jgi:hypothetical protein
MALGYNRCPLRRAQARYEEALGFFGRWLMTLYCRPLAYKEWGQDWPSLVLRQIFLVRTVLGRTGLSRAAQQAGFRRHGVIGQLALAVPRPGLVNEQR